MLRLRPDRVPSEPESVMREELDTIRRALQERDALDAETTEALATLESALGDIEAHPDGGRVREVVAGTAEALAGKGDAALGTAWSDLKEQLAHWEDEHPRIVLAIGRVSNSLAAFGL